MIPFNIDSILGKCKNLPGGGIHTLITALVGIAGLGRDIWTLQYHAINRILYVCDA